MGSTFRMKSAHQADLKGKGILYEDDDEPVKLIDRDDSFVIKEFGLCKSRSERFNNNDTAGKYEYVDVRCGGDYNRYIVETNLAEEFEIARPTKRYTSIISQVPRVFVGTPEDLKKLVKIMCHEMRRSMKQVGIHVPPWRRKGYMQAKWFSFY
ncbi:hypothetical protein F2Q69_00013941 [Brassica cretica]|uniref:Uncharacterized protein n=1 Tax=Brassica cretica TaxID=69181 RepID=A0A8S9R4T6_BRACR|nr:hypothetical protein F2Q69_00013941 [Brassica cretica]